MIGDTAADDSSAHNDNLRSLWQIGHAALRYSNRHVDCCRDEDLRPCRASEALSSSGCQRCFYASRRAGISTFKRNHSPWVPVQFWVRYHLSFNDWEREA